MELIKPSYQILTPINGDDILQSLELAARTCYKSEDNITATSAPKFCKMLLGKNHESTIEHIAITVKFIVDRGVTHELVRHRLASFSQESTRYVNYNRRGITFVIPPWTELPTGEYSLIRKSLFGHTLNPPAIRHSNSNADINVAEHSFLSSLLFAEEAYDKLIKEGWKPQQARNVLPNALKTEIVTTANLREWRHIFKLRTSNAAHPQMREIMRPLLDELKTEIPVIFDDINYE